MPLQSMGTTTANKTTIAMGVLSMAVGVIPMLAMAGILPRGDAPADPTLAWMGWLIGAVFMGAGLIVIMRGVLNASDRSDDLPAGAPPLARLANDALGIAIVCGMAAMFSWVAFGPGPRHFSIGIAGLFTNTSGSGDTIGRVAFGFGALLFWFMTAAFAVMTVRKWRR